jgi:hypothetical protein
LKPAPLKVVISTLTTGSGAGTDVALIRGPTVLASILLAPISLAPISLAPISLASCRASRHVVSLGEDRGRIAAVPARRNYG